jgi:UDP-glucose 4-epimerase
LVNEMARDLSILVTGGAGYIGAHCCKALSEAGYVPVCIDDLSTGSRDFVKWGPLVVGNVRDTALVAETIRSHRIAAVMHFAAFSQVGESVVDPQKYYSNNVGGTLSLLAAMRETGCSRLVFSSTGAVYGNAGRDPISEEAAGSPVNPYGVSKWMIEHRLSIEFRLPALFQRQRRGKIRLDRRVQRPGDAPYPPRDDGPARVCQ